MKDLGKTFLKVNNNNVIVLCLQYCQLFSFCFLLRYGRAFILLCLCHLLFEWLDDIHVLFALLLSQVARHLIVIIMSYFKINFLSLFSYE